jgi:hypothetical protein
MRAVRKLREKIATCADPEARAWLGQQTAKASQGAAPPLSGCLLESSLLHDLQECCANQSAIRITPGEPQLARRWANQKSHREKD